MARPQPPAAIPASAPDAAAAAASGLAAAAFAALRDAALAARAGAYCPYSGFRVGAAALLAPAAGAKAAEMEVVAGANVENASFPVGTCAERVALARAVADGRRAFAALAVASDLAGPCSPCGMCRQFIREFCDLEMPILLFDRDANVTIVKLEDLLPMSFGPASLEAPRAG